MKTAVALGFIGLSLLAGVGAYAAPYKSPAPLKGLPSISPPPIKGNLCSSTCPPAISKPVVISKPAAVYKQVPGMNFSVACGTLAPGQTRYQGQTRGKSLDMLAYYAKTRNPC